ncbi:MAG: hypothetical protein OXH04_22545 [Acidobacteria bacterium]|nr:hypothetical protein [Acidobacteriota bacterium]
MAAWGSAAGGSGSVSPAVGDLDPYAANEKAGVRCISAGGMTTIAHAAETRGLRWIVAADQAAAASVECGETTDAATLDELVAPR